MCDGAVTKACRAAVTTRVARFTDTGAGTMQPMFFRQVLHEDLACASYVVADGGEAAVIDPKWEIEDYLVLADEHAFRIAHVLETHNHADHLSGRGRLAEATGATLHISPDAHVEYEHEPLGDEGTLYLGDA